MREEMFTRLDYVLVIFSYFSFWFLVQDFGSD